MPHCLSLWLSCVLTLLGCSRLSLSATTQPCWARYMPKIVSIAADMSSIPYAPEDALTTDDLDTKKNNNNTKAQSPTDSSATQHSQGGDEEGAPPTKKIKLGNSEYDDVLDALSAVDRTQVTKLNPISFEKDDDQNFHIDFIWSAASLRAQSYNIAAANRLQTKIKAGNIVPAIVTTTAMVTGLVCMEMYKLIQSKPYADYRNSFANLANSIFQQSEPMPPLTTPYPAGTFTQWDKIHVERGNISLGGFLKYMKTTHNITVDTVLCGGSTVFMDFMPRDKLQERLHMKFSELIPHVTKMPIKKNQRFFALAVTGTDQKDQPVEAMPVVILWFRPRNPERKSPASSSQKRKPQK
eukprot:TRINITY_DN2171_c0_g1_i1.p2 TRINITY_DN2171_c0_g1~~TRINITY_DN2171_c0_g1_i1.p2  ORF type:complete len:353 (+),score=53.46 TRINITY_DN2171_c0_g1_i1:1086-2144(+)